ncbi:terminase [Haemophilus sputorum]|uniref:Terminase n=1 Tax=Haemophilus sputorum TaxID=1078480 RepID=A0A369YJU9_9PAST|nr:phage terminase small subunit [Haemophilus sputorum]RDE73085.1 terminase [Haemophilus sputorum]
MAERLSPAQIHLRTISAALAHAAENEDLSDFTEYEKMCRVLARHRKDLKQIQSTKLKADFKRKILPDYLPWIEGALSAGTGKQDIILMTWCVWGIDCEEYHLALQIAEYAIFHDLRLPEPFTRTLGTMIAEEFADKAKAAMAANQPFEVAYLERVQSLTELIDMPDESRARLLRELGLLLALKNPKQALECLERALSLNQAIGVKGEIKKLRKQLNKADE